MTVYLQEVSPISQLRVFYIYVKFIIWQLKTPIERLFFVGKMLTNTLFGLGLRLVPFRLKNEVMWPIWQY